MGSTGHHRLPVLIGVLVVALGAGSAFAYWTSAGVGAGGAGSGTAATLTVSPGTPSAALYPGGSTAVVAQVANSGSADVRVSSLALADTEGTAGYDVDAGHADCGLDALAFASQSNGGAGWTVPGGGSLTISMPSALTMDVAADDECQGATFTVHLKVAS